MVMHIHKLSPLSKRATSNWSIEFTNTLIYESCWQNLSFVQIFIECHNNCPIDFWYTFITEVYGTGKDIELIFYGNHAYTTDTEDRDYFVICWSIPLQRYESNIARNYII